MTLGGTLSLSEGNFFANLKKAKGALREFRDNINAGRSVTESYSADMKHAGNAVSDFIKKAVGIGAVTYAVKRVSDAAVSAAKDIIAVGSEFENQMAKVDAIADLGDSYDAVKAKAMEMGATTKFTATESAAALEYMAMAGWKADRMLAGLPAIMNLAAASGEDLASVSDIVTDAMTAFQNTLEGGINEGNILMFTDVLAKTATSANTDVTMMGESFKNVSAVAGGMGYSIKGTALALGLMANNGVKGAEAGTSLRGILTRFAKPTKDVYTAMEALGLSFVNADGSMKKLDAIIPEMQQKFSKLTEAEKGQYGTMIAGKNALQGFLAIVNSTPSDINDFKNALASADGTASAMAEKMNDTLTGQLTLLKSQLDGVKLSIYQALGESSFKDVIKGVSGILTQVTPQITDLAVKAGNAALTIATKLPEAFNTVKDFITEHEKQLKGLGIAFITLGSIVAALQIGSAINAALSGAIVVAAAARMAVMRYTAATVGMSAAQKAAAAVQMVFNAAMSANPIGIIIIAVAALTAGIIAMYKNWDKIKAKFPRFAAVVENVISTVKVYIQAAAVFLKDAFERAKPVITAVFGAVREYAVLVFGIMKAKIEIIKPIVVGVFTQIGLYVKMTFATVRNIVTTAVEHIKILFKGIVTHWVLVGKMFIQLFHGDFKGAFDTAKQIVKNALDTVRALFVNAFGGITTQLGIFRDYFSGTWSNIKNTVSGVWDGIKSGAKTTFNAVARFINNTLGKLKIDIPDWVPELGGKSFRIPQIPYLAKGGDVTRTGSAVVGERGPELLTLPRGARVEPLPDKGREQKPTNVFYITVYSDNKSEDEAVRRMAAKIKAALERV